jgi:hypothetical protein
MIIPVGHLHPRQCRRIAARTPSGGRPFNGAFITYCGIAEPDLRATAPLAP